MRGELPSTRGLLAFAAAARHENLHAAAAELCVTVSALSKQVRQLEADVGVPLFERQGGRLKLVEAGRLYADRVEAILRDLRDATQALSPPAPVDSLYVMAPSAFANHCLLPYLGEFMSAEGGVPVAIVNSTGKGRPDFAKTRADAAVVLTDGTCDAPDLSCDPIFHRPYLVAACSPRLLPDGHAIDDPQSFSRLTWLALRAIPKTWDCWLDAAGWVGLKPSNLLWYDDGQTMINAARAGVGVILTGGAEGLPPPAMKEGGLVLAHSFHYFVRTFAHLMVPRAKLRQPAVASFRKWLLGLHAQERRPAAAILLP